jgi:hypothetical protein
LTRRRKPDPIPIPDTRQDVRSACERITGHLHAIVNCLDRLQAVPPGTAAELVVLERQIGTIRHLLLPPTNPKAGS